MRSLGCDRSAAYLSGLASATGKDVWLAYEPAFFDSVTTQYCREFPSKGSDDAANKLLADRLRAIELRGNGR